MSADCPQQVFELHVPLNPRYCPFATVGLNRANENRTLCGGLIRMQIVTTTLIQ